MLEKEEELCFIANDYVKKGEKTKLPEIDKLLVAIRTSRVILKGYTEIEGEDRNTVDYFNSFTSRDGIPKDKEMEFIMLQSKYMTKWLDEKENYQS